MLWAGYIDSGMVAAECRKVGAAGVQYGHNCS